MSIIDAVRTAFAALAANRMRSALTMLGIIIGVSAVITLMAVGQGAQKGVTERIRGLGSNLLFIRPGQVETSDAARAVAQGQALTLVDADAYAINDPERFPYVEGVAPQVTFDAQLIAGAQNTRTTITGTTTDYQYVRDFYATQGQFITDDDVTRKALVAVLGSRLAQTLFGDANPIGKTVRLAVGPGGFISFTFRVVGVMEPKGATATGDEDDLMFIPLPTMQARIPFLRHPQGLSNVMQISVKIKDKGQFDRAQEEIAALLRERHQVAKDDFVIRTQDDLITTASDVSRTLTILLASIASISLVVGGIGIMNIMLVSVTERTREIGIRKAVGAKRRDILTQFLVEALTVTMAGGGIGVLVGVSLAKLASGQTIADEDIQTVISPLAVILAFGVSAAIGIFFGIYPAFRAARLNPIEALRHE
ncbi:MAG: ABC transporter permease [Bacillota bacterium]|nr:ABC transporter permease [Bacillota bacterium]